MILKKPFPLARPVCGWGEGFLAKEHNKLIESLSNGTEVVVSNGIMGKIIKMKDDVIELEVSQGINIKVRKNSITTVLPKGSI